MKKLQTKIEDFIQRRDWQQFHSPKNLAMALSVETAELLEIFQWMETEESHHVDAATHVHIEEEIGDIMIYLTTLAGKFGINPLIAAHRKIAINEEKFPVEIVRGKAAKHDTY